MIVEAERGVDVTVNTVILDTLAPFRDELGIADVRIVPDESHAGEPVIRVWLEHRPVEPTVADDSFRRVDEAVRDAVWDKGERRFVLFSHKFGKLPDALRR